MQSSCSPLKKEDDCLKKGCCLFVKKTNVSNVVTAAECVPKALGFKWLSAGDTEHHGPQFGASRACRSIDEQD